MTAPSHHIYLHFVWHTWNSHPFLSEDIRLRVHAAIAAKSRDLGCEPLAVGGTEDHVHVLLRVRPSHTPSEIIRNLKGGSAHLVNHEIRSERSFKWQGSYGVYSVCENRVAAVRAYIQRQVDHHSEELGPEE